MSEQVSYGVIITVVRYDGNDVDDIDTEEFGFDSAEDVVYALETGIDPLSGLKSAVEKCQVSGANELSFKELREQFEKDILPEVFATYGPDDINAIDEAYNNWTDTLCKDGIISQWQYDNDPGYLGG